jgi:hypothetical protein
MEQFTAMELVALLSGLFYLRSVGGGSQGQSFKRHTGTLAGT